MSKSNSRANKVRKVLAAKTTPSKAARLQMSPLPARVLIKELPPFSLKTSTKLVHSVLQNELLNRTDTQKQLT